MLMPKNQYLILFISSYWTILRDNNSNPLTIPNMNDTTMQTKIFAYKQFIYIFISM